MVRNRALREAGHGYVLLTDNDVTFAPDAMVQLMAVMLGRPDAAVCTPLVVCDDDRDTVYGQAHQLHFLCWELRSRRELLRPPAPSDRIERLDAAFS